MMKDVPFSNELDIWRKQFRTILTEFQAEAKLKQGQLLVIGCSTSEVVGKRIGSEGTMEVAGFIFTELQSFQAKTGVQLAFQCCEHLNRALVLERSSIEVRRYEEVSVVPVRKAGGAMATYAFHQFQNPTVVEHIKADGGIDIGDTFIGMHLKHVAVPVRSSVKELGYAHVTMAKTRPKLIGGERAIYTVTEDNKSCS